jgi:hypothetical protein
MVSSNNARIFYKLNNYDYSRENLERVKDYLRTGQTPADLNDRQRATFVQRYGRGEFEVKRNRVFYKPLGVELVCKEDIEAKLQPLYDDFKVGVGSGIKGFYAKVLQKYIGINRDEVAVFLRKQTPYQLTKQPRRPINRPVIGNYPNHRWECDLIDMALYAGNNKRKKYILTVIDVFSRYVFAEPLANKTPLSVVAAFRRIKKKSKVWPVILQCDQGTEFKGEFEEFAEASDIKIVHSLTHTPQTNGMV